MKLYQTRTGAIAEHSGLHYPIDAPSWDALITRDDLADHLKERVRDLAPAAPGALDQLLAPIGSQEVWAAGVTYHRSRAARMEEAKAAGGGDFYDRVYDAERPELFFKATPHRVAGPGEAVAIRDDSSWSVPEPELTLLVTPSGNIIGYTVGNDMSSRDIEGENPLYLPQAKVYDRSCALGPCILVSSEPLPASTEIALHIVRDGQTAFAGSTKLEALKRDPASLVHYLFRHNSFPHGCFLLTGTGIVPPDSFTLRRGDQIHITIAPIGTLTNHVG
ncbi:MAG: fumarylacetoacetate hydrolase family protein [Bryobacteraceae bacterium]|jgi:2-dehydro-3-deoxy-D-arabinonate dehydratase